MPSQTHRAQPALNFIPPRYSAGLRQVLQPFMPAVTAWKTDIAEVETHNVEALAKLYHEFKLGKTRILLAFRHPSPTDPYALSHLLWKDLPSTARQMGLKIGTTHSHFIYDRGIPLWAGSYLGWVFSRLGGIPIQRGKLDLTALKSARRLLLDGRFPLAAAPEGGNNSHNEIISPLEPGISQLAFWCAEDIEAAGRSESVVILPIGIQYQYLTPPWTQLENLIGQLEIDNGIGGHDVELPSQQVDLYKRLYQLAEHLLTLMESYYREFYGVSFSSLGCKTDFAEPNDHLSERLQRLMDEALQVAEQYFKVRAKGSVIDRCRKLEQAGWDRIFREDAMSLSAVERGLADRVAAEANLRMWHMRLVESFVAVTGCYVKEHPSADRFAETALLLRDMVAKIKGEKVLRSRLGKQRAIVTVGEPIEVSSRLADYQTKRRGAIMALTKDLRLGMESLILTD
ncbi:MAG: 1-acyl-sn-glycerol-3-phosphate acyltransferase [Phormidesmis sp.]